MERGVDRWRSMDELMERGGGMSRQREVDEWVDRERWMDG